MINNTSDVKKGQRCRDKDNNPWRIVSLQNDIVSVSGPGPLRSLQNVPINEFIAEWIIY
jgi:hypothetical protein